MQERVKEIMSNVFQVESSMINESTSPETLEAWDSLKHMNLIVALEEEFQIEFTDDEILNMLDYKTILYQLSEKI